MARPRSERHASVTGPYRSGAITGANTRRQRRGDTDAASLAFVEDPPERSGTLILRVWLETGRADGFRARIIRSVGKHQAPPSAVTSADDVHAAVQAWLDELLEPDG